MKSKLLISRNCILSVSLFLFFSLYENESFAQYLSIEVLYANGHKEYNSDNWVYASVYLFAYIQRNPKEFSDQIYKKEVIAAYDFSVQQLNKQSAEYKTLLAKQKQMEQNQDGIGSTTQGLVIPKPALRRPSLVPLVSDKKL